MGDPVAPLGTVKATAKVPEVAVGLVVPVVAEPVNVDVCDDVGIGVVGATGPELSSGSRTDFELLIIVNDRELAIPPFVKLLEVDAVGKVKLLIEVLESAAVVEVLLAPMAPSVT